MSPYTFYFAGELFSQKHLLGNAMLAKAIFDQSNGKYLAILPQDLEFRDTSSQAIRDQDLVSLIQSDLALFHFDGPELDSGTVVEFMTAKFADIPSVVLRTDFREAGDQDGKGDPWNLMCSFYPRTETVLSPSILSSADAGHQRQNIENYSSELLEQNLIAQIKAVDTTAQQVIDAFDKVIQQSPVIKQDHQAAIYEHLSRFPGFTDHSNEYAQHIQKALKLKKGKKLL
ncbi:nucleoside 2-deoxyribosyltransferase [Rubritalea spongiae]|uniref:Nucleoside 2-deoxyribosyltransferase n=1 Tax=Rubritalea spongiae TaxID=430797 RepID=A0ABW5E177_9BACT